MAVGALRAPAALFFYYHTKEPEHKCSELTTTISYDIKYQANATIPVREGEIKHQIRYILGRVSATFAKTVLTVAIVVWLWVTNPGIINQLMDLNLDLIRWIGVTVPYGAQIESALRLMAGEKSIVFLEVLFALNVTLIILRFCGRMCWRGCRLTFGAFRRRFAA